MGNDQLLPAYNIQIGVADEYIAVVDVMQYRSDIDCFIPLMENVLVRIIQEHCPDISGTLSQIGKNHQSCYSA